MIGSITWSRWISDRKVSANPRAYSIARRDPSEKSTGHRMRWIFIAHLACLNVDGSPSSILAEEEDQIRQLVDRGDVEVTVAVAIVQDRAAAGADGRQRELAAERATPVIAEERVAGAAKVARRDIEIAVAVEVAEVDRDRERADGIRHRRAQV